MKNQISNKRISKSKIINKAAEIMKTLISKKSTVLLVLALVLFAFTNSSQAQGWNPELETEAEEALSTLLEETPKLASFKDKSYGYAVFPKITKAAATVGGAAGNGIVYKDHVVLGKAHLKQATVGVQLGGQQYIEVIFFENKESFEKFIDGKLKFDAQASAVALKKGASIDAAYQDGVSVFTATKGGLMYEAAIGGQHFKYTPKAED
jgi:lipid-binding SYLF domain-containing protein